VNKKKLILFIHGLGGSKETWGNFEELIKEYKSFKDFDVEFFVYKSKIASGKSLVAIFSNMLSIFIPQKRLPKIQDIADLLQTEIDERYREYDEIYLITHSMGGLVARKYLYDMIKNKKDIKVKKLMLYAVPNNGSDWAKLSKLYSHEQIVQLDRDSDFMQDLNRELQSIRLEDYLDILYIIGKYDEVVDEASARGYWGNTNVKSLQKGHRDIVKPIDSKDLTFIVFKNFLIQNVPSMPNNISDSIKPTRDSSPFVNSVYQILNTNRLVVCYSQDFNDIAKEYKLLKGYMKYKFNNHFYNITIPSFIDDEKKYFQALIDSAGMNVEVESANDWKRVMENILKNSDSRVLFIFSNIDNGNDKLNTLMARIIRSLRDEHSNFYAICIGRKKLAYLVYGENRLSPLNTAEEIFFPINNQIISETKVTQILKQFEDDRELICECLGGSERWMIWNYNKSINELFWRGILINNNGKYAWKSEEIKNLAKDIYSCDKIQRSQQ